MFGWFKKKRIGGDIAMMGLEDWWLSTFSEADREWMANTYAPMGSHNRPLVEGGPYFPKPEPFSYLANAATWFSKPGYEHCAIAFLEKSMEFCTDDIPVLDRHFSLYHRSQVFYRWRDTIPGALEKCIAACELCIGFHEEAARAFMNQYRTMVKHPCFDRLRIIEEKRGNYTRALELCHTAQKAGWEDDWPKHIARLEKKMAKAGQPSTR